MQVFTIHTVHSFSSTALPQGKRHQNRNFVSIMIMNPHSVVKSQVQAKVIFCELWDHSVFNRASPFSLFASGGKRVGAGSRLWLHIVNQPTREVAWVSTEKPFGQGLMCRPINYVGESCSDLGSHGASTVVAVDTMVTWKAYGDKVCRQLNIGTKG